MEGLKILQINGAQPLRDLIWGRIEGFEEVQHM